MALYFNAAKDGDKFSNLGGSLENCNSKLIFDEARIQKTDDGIYKIFMSLTDASDVTNINDRSWKFSPCLASVTLHASEYEKNKKVNDQWVKEKVQPSKLEVFFCEYFENNAELFLNDEMAFKGYIHLWDNDQTFNAIRTGKQPTGEDIPESGLAFIKTGLFGVTPTEIDKLKDLPAATNGKKSWGGSKGQTEAERLKERTAQFVAHCNDMELLENGQFETLSAIHAYFANYSEEPDELSVAALNILRILMG